MQASPTFAQDTFLRHIEPAIEQLGCTLSPETLARLYDYFALFLKWNRSYNLSAIRDPKEALFKHLVDSLSIQPHFAAHPSQHVIDVGTGGGFPGIVLAICHPDRQFTLLDSAGKKVRFLFQVVQSLRLDNVQLENRRVESFQPEQAFDLVISRAFASIKNFTDLTSHLLQPKGEFWAMKGLFPEAELSEMQKHYIVAEHRSLSVPGVDGERCLIRIVQS